MSCKLTLHGADALATRLAEFPERTRGTVLRPALRTGAGVIARAQRGAVPRGLSDVKAAIGSRGVKKGARLLQAKAGGGVGRPRAAKLGKRTGKRAGVGISGNNIQWWTLGTQGRYTGSKSSGGGQGRKGRRYKRVVYQTGNARRFRGRMPAHSLRAASQAAQGPALFAMKSSIAKGIAREWEKQQKKSSRY